ncbi:MAG: endonuclease/exonuclease/phosphatase family protein [Kiloniellales bacterium]|nr:endonuclease/exonuclease/phosphatase family protein [Kiloniellales bacterium]
MRYLGKLALHAVLLIGLLCGLGATLAGLVGDLHWVLELFSHFKVQLAVGSAILLVIAMASRSASGAALASALLLVNLYPVWPYLSDPFDGAEAAQSPSLKAMTFNLHHGNADLDAVEAFLDSEKPGFALLTELPPDARTWLKRLRKGYPHQAVDRVASPFDVVLISRHPLRGVRFDRRIAAQLPVLSARVCPNTAAGRKGCVTVVGLHAANPLGASPLRDKQIRLAAGKAQRAPAGAVVLLGDLNTSPWSPIFTEALAVGRLRDSALGFPLSATWFSRNPLFGLPINHVLLGRGMEAVARRVGPDLGSDHLPVIAELRRR